MWLLIPILITVHVLVCLLMVLIVLMQLPRSEGLGAAFGGAVTENIFGAQTTNVLARFTVWLGVAFFALTLLLAIAYAKATAAENSGVQRHLNAAPIPTATATPSPAAAASPAVTEPMAPAPAASPVAPSPSP